jgi:hypothetical protein
MTIAIIIIAYVLNVFLNRWLNKLMCKYCEYEEPMPLIWFLPIFTTLVFTIEVLGYKEKNWFTGKYWK